MSAPRSVEEVEAIVSASVWSTAVHNDRNDSSWADLGKDCGLSGPELSILKNNRFPPAQRGKRKHRLIFIRSFHLILFLSFFYVLS